MNKRLRIVHVSKGGGGLDVYVKNIMSFTDPNKFEHYVVWNRASGDLEAWCQQKNIRFFHIDMIREIKFREDFRATRQLRQILQQIRPHIVHLHSSKAGVIGRIAWRKKKERVIYTPNACAYHAVEGLKRKLYLGIESILAPATGLLLASSESEMRSLRNDLWLAPGEIDYFYNSLDVEEFEREGISTEDMYDGRRIVCAARLIAQKNPLMLVRVAETVHRSEPDVTFHILGAGLDDFLGEEVRREIERRGLQNVFHIHAWMSKKDALRFVGRSSIAVSTAAFESFGFFVVEAEALGKPVVATRVLGIEDVVSDGHSGFLVPPNDDAAMAERLLQLVRDPRLRQTMGRAGATFVRDKFAIRSTISAIEEIYSKRAAAALALKKDSSLDLEDVDAYFPGTPKPRTATVRPASNRQETEANTSAVTPK